MRTVNPADHSAARAIECPDCHAPAGSDCVNLYDAHRLVHMLRVYYHRASVASDPAPIMRDELLRVLGWYLARDGGTAFAQSSIMTFVVYLSDATDPDAQRTTLGVLQPERVHERHVRLAISHGWLVCVTTGQRYGRHRFMPTLRGKAAAQTQACVLCDQRPCPPDTHTPDRWCRMRPPPHSHKGHGRAAQQCGDYLTRAHVHERE